MDFDVTNYGSVWNIRAVSKDAIAFARENFAVEAWQGKPENFTTDHRPARALVEQLAEDGWRVAK
jgi:hypothetical protein